MTLAIKKRLKKSVVILNFIDKGQSHHFTLNLAENNLAKVITVAKIIIQILILI